MKCCLRVRAVLSYQSTIFGFSQKSLDLVPHTPLPHTLEPYVCPSGWIPSQQSGTCIKLSREKDSWHGARNICKSDGGDLMEIADDATKLFVSGKPLNFKVPFAFLTEELHIFFTMTPASLNNRLFNDIFLVSFRKSYKKCVYLFVFPVAKISWIQQKTYSLILFVCCKILMFC